VFSKLKIDFRKENGTHILEILRLIWHSYQYNFLEKLPTLMFFGIIIILENSAFHYSVEKGRSPMILKKYQALKVKKNVVFACFWPSDPSFWGSANLWWGQKWLFLSKEQCSSIVKVNLICDHDRLVANLFFDAGHAHPICLHHLNMFWDSLLLIVNLSAKFS